MKAKMSRAQAKEEPMLPQKEGRSKDKQNYFPPLERGGNGADVKHSIGPWSTCYSSARRSISREAVKS